MPIADNIFILDGGKAVTLPSRDVTPQQFRLAAVEACWDKTTIDLFLKPPLFYGRVKVGGEGLKLVEVRR